MARDAHARAGSTLAPLAAGALVFVLATTGAFAQDRQGAQSPVGGPGWNNTSVTQAPAVAGLTLDARQMELVQKVNDYFNGLENMKGQFVQTTSDNKRLKGKFFMKKPGRVRFEYSLPSKQLVISDGQQIAIQDLDINTDDRVTVDQTPFRVLLRKDVDLVRDARILEVQEAADLLIVALQDKSKDSTGRVRLFMATTPALELKEWVTTDAQGTDTRIEVSNLDRNEQIDAGLFKITSPQISKQ